MDISVVGSAFAHSISQSSVENKKKRIKKEKEMKSENYQRAEPDIEVR